MGGDMTSDQEQALCEERTKSTHAPNMVSLRTLVVLTASIGMMCGLIGGYVGHVLGDKSTRPPIVGADTMALENKFRYSAEVRNSIGTAMGRFYKIEKKEADFSDVMKKCDVDEDYIKAF